MSAPIGARLDAVTGRRGTQTKERAARLGLLPRPASLPDGGELGDFPASFGFVEPPPPYYPGPRRKLPGWAKHLRHLRPLQLVK